MRPQEKDTTENGGKPRDASLPHDAERDFRQYQFNTNIAPKDPFIHLSERGVRAAVKQPPEPLRKRPAIRTSSSCQVTISVGGLRSDSSLKRKSIRAR